MKSLSWGLVLLVLFMAFLPTDLLAGSDSNLKKVLESWQGDKEVQLLNGGNDPLASPELLHLIETFLRYGFAVRPATGKAVPPTGLLAEIRHTAQADLVVLKRASDDTIVALERLEKKPAVAATGTEPPVRSLDAQPTVWADESPRARKFAPLALEDSAVAVVWLSGDFVEGGDLALLSERGVTLFRLKGTNLEKVVVVAPPKKGLRPLTLSQGDLDGDGTSELAAVWAEDIHGIYEGTNSRIWSQLLSFKARNLNQLAVLPEYVRLFPSSGVAQLRGDHSAFTGEVQELAYRNGEFTIGKELAWGGQNLFALTPWRNGTGLVWQKPGKVVELSLQGKSPVAGGSLLENIGEYIGQSVSVRLANPEFRSGFEKEDKIYDRNINLPPRFILGQQGTLVTISRGRKPGNILSPQASGKDRLISLSRDENGLLATYPFNSVEAFIIDFSLLPKGGQNGALLLLNEKEDGSGRAFLLYQMEN